MNKQKAIIIFTVAIDVLGLGIIIPVLPLYVESLGATPFMVTILLSVFSLFAFLSAPFLGALSDKIGRRPVLLISIFSTSMGWLIFALANSYPLLLLGRVIDGLAAGNFSTAQSSISDLSKTPEERTANLGTMGMIFGLGFIIGPFIGGILSHISMSFPFFFVAGLALANTILAYFWLPETNKQINAAKKLSWNPIQPLFKATQNLHLRPLYLVWLLFNTLAFLRNSVFALYLSQVFGYGSLVAGIFFMIVGAIIALNQGFLIRKFWLKKFKEKKLILMMLALAFLSFPVMSVPLVGFFIVSMVMTAFAQSTINVALTSEIVGEAQGHERGEAVGVLTAIASLAMIIAPLIAGSLFQIKVYYPYILGGILSIIAWVIMYRVRVRDEESKEISDLAKEVVA